VQLMSCHLSHGTTIQFYTPFGLAMINR